MNLRDSLEQQINCASAENGSNTPDWILAEYLIGCLAAFDAAVNAREGFYGRHASAPINTNGACPVGYDANGSLVSAESAGPKQGGLYGTGCNCTPAQLINGECVSCTVMKQEG